MAARATATVKKSRDAFRTISEVAMELDVPPHVLRFWESKFSVIRPLKRGGNRRYYRPEDIRLLSAIKILLYESGYTIKGAQKLFKDNGLRSVVNSTLESTASVSPASSDAAADAGGTPEGGGSGVDIKALQDVLKDLEAMQATLRQALNLG